MIVWHNQLNRKEILIFISEKYMLRKIVLISVALAALGGCSSTLEPLHDEVIPYDNSKSFAYNVATQGGFHYKLNDVDVPDKSVVRTTSTMGHLANTFILSPNFLGSLGLSLTSDDSHGADRTQLILSMKVPKKDADQFIANTIFDAIRKIDPTSEFLDVDYKGGGVVKYKHKGAICTKWAQDNLSTIGESKFYRKILTSGKCKSTMTMTISGPSNSKLFSHNNNEKTVLVSLRGQIVTRSYLQALPNAYFYATNYKINRVSTIPMHIEHKGKMHFFIKPIHNILPTDIEDSEIYKYKIMGIL